MRILLVAFLLTLSENIYSQKFAVTPTGLRDEKSIENSYLVFDFDSLTATQLFGNAKKFIMENYKSPKDVVKAEIENEYLKFDTFEPEMFKYKNGFGIASARIPIKANYTTELRFKDGKVRYEVISLKMTNEDGKYSVLFSGGLFEGYVIYKKNGELYREDAKVDIESYFNAMINDLVKYLNGYSKNSDW